MRIFFFIREMRPVGVEDQLGECECCCCQQSMVLMERFIFEYGQCPQPAAGTDYFQHFLKGQLVRFCVSIVKDLWTARKGQ